MRTKGWLLGMRHWERRKGLEAIVAYASSELEVCFSHG